MTLPHLPPGAPLGVALLGSTGSIGRQAVDVLTSAGEDRFSVVALAAGRDADTLSQQAASLRPRLVSMAEPAAAARLRLPEDSVLLDAPDALTQMAVHDDVDLVIVATGGVVSLRPVLAALAAGKIVATANKETLVSGGHLVMPLAGALARAGRAAGSSTPMSSPMASPLAWLRPIDSEHSAIWQCLAGEDLADVARLILTASGGPFREWSSERMQAARPRDALRHPNWSMGSKITIDSATLMNKGLEVIEAHWLYDVRYEDVDVVIHPQSLVHSFVEFVDGSMKAQLGLPDMRIPIQYAVTFPQRTAGPAPRLELTEHPHMTFEAPDETRFPALRIARAAGVAGPGASAALIPADDIAVARFLAGELSYPGMAWLVEAAIERFAVGHAPELEELEAIDAAVRAWARDAQVPTA
ncbi:MAG TPA: 1-deoxy-D-xylulose-5-phosphate reductoisomerase [Anaerolineae bacterium]|nr:1-deoxy-D-xylulose-5-phosphate reductoisomerase [Anaerolineae bacterium]